jgi:hypothetical protein
VDGGLHCQPIIFHPAGEFAVALLAERIWRRAVSPHSTYTLIH